MHFKKLYRGVGFLVLLSIAWTLLSPITTFAQTQRYVSNQTIFYEMLQRMSKVKAYDFEGRHKVRLPENGDGLFQTNQFNVLFYGSEEKGVLNNLDKTHFSLSFYDERQDIDVYPRIEAISEGNDFYFKLSNLAWVANMLSSLENSFSLETNSSSEISTTTNFQDKYGFDLIDNQWLKISEESLKSFYSELGLPADELFDHLEMKEDVSEKQLRDVLLAARKHNVLIFTRLKDETVKGVDTYHLKLTLNKTRVVPFLTELNKILKEEIFTKDELKELSKDIVKWKQLPSAEVWVGKKDFLLRKFIVKFEISEMFKENMEKIALELSMSFDKYDVPLLVRVPSNFKKIEEVIGDLMKKWGINDLMRLN